MAGKAKAAAKKKGASGAKGQPGRKKGGKNIRP